jgi:hypothetical protein
VRAGRTSRQSRRVRDQLRLAVGHHALSCNKAVEVLVLIAQGPMIQFEPPENPPGSATNSPYAKKIRSSDQPELGRAQRWRRGQHGPTPGLKRRANADPRAQQLRGALRQRRSCGPARASRSGKAMPVCWGKGRGIHRYLPFRKIFTDRVATFFSLV